MLRQRKRLVVILAWLGAKQSSVSKYEDLYPKDEYDFFVHYPVAKDFLWPKHGLSSALSTLDTLDIRLKRDGYSHIIIHAFSIGCYYYSLMLYQMRMNCKYVGLWKMISAQILDSPVMGSTSEMAYGLGKMLSTRPAVVGIIKYLCLLYFTLSESHTIHYFDLVIEEIKFRSRKVPSLLLTSVGDPMLVMEAFNDFSFQWKKHQPTVTQIWQDSSHAEHLRYHPNEYRSLLTKLLIDSKNNVSDSKHLLKFANSKL